MTNFGWLYIDHNQHDKVVFECPPMPLTEADKLYRKTVGQDVTKQFNVGATTRQVPRTSEEWQAWRKDFLTSLCPPDSIVLVKNKDETYQEVTVFGEPEFIQGVGWYLKYKRNDNSHDGYNCISFLYVKIPVESLYLDKPKSGTIKGMVL